MPSLPPSKFHVPTRNRNYPKSAGVSRTGGLDFTANDLAHAPFTTGWAPGDQATFGATSYFVARHRISLIPAYVRRDATVLLRTSRLANELDRSEKGSLSYALGQAAAALFCYENLGVTHLMHVDRYAS